MKSPGITSWQRVRMAVEEGRQPKLVSWSEGCSNPPPSSTASGEPGGFQRWGEGGGKSFKPRTAATVGFAVPLAGFAAPT